LWEYDTSYKVKGSSIGDVIESVFVLPALSSLAVDLYFTQPLTQMSIGEDGYLTAICEPNV
jgi:hypothetical protein